MSGLESDFIHTVGCLLFSAYLQGSKIDFLSNIRSLYLHKCVELFSSSKYSTLASEMLFLQTIIFMCVILLMVHSWKALL